MKYSAAVKENLSFMKTPADQWAAVPVTGVDATTGLPLFDFPHGYAQQKSLYAGTTEQPCCELCGHRIRRVFWLQNDTTKTVLAVGSECVTHFQEQSGEQMVKAATAAEKKALLERTRALSTCRVRDKVWEAIFAIPVFRVPRELTTREISAWYRHHGETMQEYFNIQE